MVNIKIPMPIEFVLSKLHSGGYEAYIVGGCVRDSILGITPHDWDICTSALPEQIIEVFDGFKVIPTGLKHGTVTVVIEDEEYKQSIEITTYRIDGEYTDNRHPDNVKFVSDISLDLMRRDFTMNAMAYNHKDGMIDLFGGVEDIESGTLRCVGNPDDRFKEDALRIMRAIRFAFKYDMQIDEEVLLSIRRNKSLLKNVSSERICSELTKILESDIGGKNKNEYLPGELSNDNLNCSNKNRIELIGYLLELLQEVFDYDISFDEQEVYNRLVYTYPELSLRLAILFDTPDLKNILKELRFSNDVLNAACKIYEYGHKILFEKYHWAYKSSILTAVNDLHLSTKEYNIESDNSLRYYARAILNEIGHFNFENIIEFAESCVSDEYTLVALNILKLQMQHCKKNDIYCLQYLAVNGNDVMKLGFTGKEVGDILNKLLDMVMREEIINDRDELLAAVSNMR